VGRDRALTLIAMIICVGCDSGAGRMSVRGKVTFHGQPVQRGTIQFAPAERTAGQSGGGVITDGLFEVSAEGGLLAGQTYVVRIIALRGTGRTAPNRLDPDAPPVEVEENYIPPIYNSQSTLTVTISETASENTFEFPLDS